MGDSTTRDFYARHVEDSLQLLDIAHPDAKSWLDIGSGGGCPGIPLAIFLSDVGRDLKMALVESDGRKAAFLNNIKTLLRLDIQIWTDRIERIPVQAADVVSARAVAPLVNLLTYAKRHLAPDGRCIFPKGENLRDEIDVARRKFDFENACHPSKIDGGGTILEIWNIEPTDGAGSR